MHRNLIFFLVFILIILSYFYLKDDKVYIETIETIEKSEVYYYIFASITEIHKKDNLEFDITKIDNLREKNKFDKKLKQKVIKLLKMPNPVVLNPKVDIVEDIDKGKYIQRKIRLYTAPFTFSYAYLLIPKEETAERKVVIVMHQHGGNYEYGKEEAAGNIGNENMFFGRELVERGYVVFAMDAPLFGENNQFFQNSGIRNSPAVEEEFATQSLLLYDYTPLGIIVEQDLTALNFLLNLEGVDKDNIGCIGHSFGGVRCMYLSALDERIKVTVISNSVGKFRREYNKSIVHTWLTLLPGIAKYTEVNGILALISPRPLMVLYSENDPIFPKSEVEDEIHKLEKLYERLGQDDKFTKIYLKKIAHEFPLSYHEQAYEFLDKHLKT